MAASSSRAYGCPWCFRAFPWFAPLEKRTLQPSSAILVEIDVFGHRVTEEASHIDLNT